MGITVTDDGRPPCSNLYEYGSKSVSMVPQPFIFNNSKMTTKQWMTQDMVDMSGKVVFVTGGNGCEELVTRNFHILTQSFQELDMYPAG